MNLPRSSSLYFASLALAFASPLVAQHQGHAGHGAAKQQETAATKGKLGKLTKAEKQSEWAQQARANYPLDVCVVSEERLDSMGGAAEYAYRVEGQPDRLVQFCCAGCDGDFADNPAAFLAKLDEAARNKTAGEKQRN